MRPLLGKPVPGLSQGLIALVDNFGGRNATETAYQFGYVVSNWGSICNRHGLHHLKPLAGTLVSPILRRLL
jgi:hypothetical protein